jgi:N-dimethylarginine dimethylaminohydrolase
MTPPKTTSHSEYHPIDTVYIKPVEHAFLSEDALSKQWKNLNYLSQPNLSEARKEYKLFEELLEHTGASIIHMPSDASLSIDAIYCRDASIATDFGMIICTMGKNARNMEPEAHRTIFEAANIPILGTIQAPGTLEGGDVAWLATTTLAVGHGYRTNKEGIRQLKGLLTPLGIHALVVDLPHFRGPSDVFHLMSILSPVDHNLAVVYSPLMPISFRNELLDRGYSFIEVPENEFDSLGSNVLATAPRKCIMVAGNPATEHALRIAGCEVVTFGGAEISIKGGGGPTCLTRPFKRRL